MKLNELLLEKREAVINAWVDQVLDTYESAGFLKKQQDRFANPIGANTRECLHRIFLVLQEENNDLGAIAEPLETLVKIRAVQDFAPSRATGFVFQVKDLVRKALTAETDPMVQALITAFEERVDTAALMTFDLYMSCRERLHRIRIRELESGTHVLTTGTSCPSAAFRHRRQKAPVTISNPDLLT